MVVPAKKISKRKQEEKQKQLFDKQKWSISTDIQSQLVDGHVLLYKVWKSVLTNKTLVLNSPVLNTEC